MVHVFRTVRVYTEIVYNFHMPPETGSRTWKHIVFFLNIYIELFNLDLAPNFSIAAKHDFNDAFYISTCNYRLSR